MKIRNIVPILVLVLVLSTFSGCGMRQMEARLDAVEDAVENRVDKVEDKLENAVESAVYGESEAKAPKAQKPSSKASDAKSYDPVLSGDEAEKIAIEHAGLNADELSFVRSEYEIDDGVKQYDIEFYHGRLEYEYSIHADSGDIISFEVDR